jgi:glycine betaine catabolism B
MKFQELETKLTEKIQRTHNVTSFRFDDRGEVSFRPGQFFQLFLDWQGEELDHWFSFSSSPTEKGFFEFTKKMSGSDYSDALRTLEPGSRVRIKYPMGKFIYEGEPNQAAFLSGGIGITPIRSICRWLTDTGSKADARVLYSARTPGDFVFLDDFEEMGKRNPNLSLVLTLTDQDPPAGWDCRTGRICSEMVREEIPDYRDRTFYVCGPPGMVAGMIGMLKDDLHLSPEQVISEDFKGY